MKRQIALVLAGTAAIVAGYLRLVQELIDRGDRGKDSEAPSSSSNGDSATREQNGTAKSSSASGSTKAPAKATKSELYETATKLEISGRSKMSKAELIEAINHAS